MSKQCNRERRGGPYRSRRAIVFGVCRGMAEHLGMSPFWMRVVVFALFVFTGFWPMGAAYILLAFFLKLEPAVQPETDDDQEFYGSMTASRTLALQRIKRTYDSLDRRIQRMEAAVVDRERDWDRRFNETT